MVWLQISTSLSGERPDVTLDGSSQGWLRFMRN
jgi:hypothetical protein